MEEDDIELTENELKVFDKYPKITLVHGMNNKETFIQGDNVYDAICELKKKYGESQQIYEHFVLGKYVSVEDLTVAFEYSILHKEDVLTLSKFMKLVDKMKDGNRATNYKEIS